MKRLQKRMQDFSLSLKLSTRLTVLMVLFLVVPTMLICELMFANMKSSLITRQQNNSAQLLAASNSQLNTALASYWQTGQAAAEMVRLEMDYVEQTGVFRSKAVSSIAAISANNSDILGVRVFLNTQSIKPQPPVLYNSNTIKQQPWYALSIPYSDTRKLHILYPSYFTSSIANNNGSAGYGVFLVPVYANGHLFAVVETSISFRALFAVMDNLPENAWISFVDSSGTLHYDKENTSQEWSNMIGSVVYGAAETHLTGPGAMLQIGSHNVVVASAPVDQMPGKLILGMQIDEELLRLQRLKLFFYCALFLFIVICAMLMNSAVRHMLKRFEQLTLIAQEVSRGNLGVTVPDMGRDEIGEFAAALDGTLFSLRELLDKSVSRELLVKTTELRALQSQINSHFIYNVLESIKMMAEIEERYDISDAVTSLGELLRYSMRWSNSMVHLEEELNYIKAYMALQNLLYDFTVDLIIQVPEEYYSQQIPKMSLQPLVENAVMHGIEEAGVDAEITISLQEVDDHVEIEVTDTGQGMTDRELDLLQKRIKSPLNTEKKRGGIGLRNVQERLHLCFGPQYGLYFYSKPGRFTTVVVKLPLSKEARDETSADRGR